MGQDGCKAGLEVFLPCAVLGGFFVEARFLRLCQDLDDKTRNDGNVPGTTRMPREPHSGPETVPKDFGPGSSEMAALLLEADADADILTRGLEGGS